jgi:hypothetical protein
MDPMKRSETNAGFGRSSNGGFWKGENALSFNGDRLTLSPPHCLFTLQLFETTAKHEHCAKEVVAVSTTKSAVVTA